MAAFGMTPEDYEQEDIISLWPDNWLSFGVFAGMSTQWRIGASGVIGLDYNALNTVMKLKGVKKKQRKKVFNDVQVMEAEALEIILNNK